MKGEEVGEEIREVGRGPTMQGLVGHDDIFGLLPLESFEQKSDLIRLKCLKGPL